MPDKNKLDSGKASNSSDLLASILNLSENAKEWIYDTCSYFEDGCGYRKDEKAIAECLKAGLIRLERKDWITLKDGVFDIAYSEGKAKHSIS